MRAPKNNPKTNPVPRRAAVWRSSGPGSGYRTSGYPFYLVTRLSSRYYACMEAVLKDIGMDVPRWRVLLILNEIRVASVSEIAAHAVSKLPTMTKTVQRLEKDGLVRTTSRQTDGRVTEVALTARGRQVVARVRPKGRLVFKQAFRDIDDQAIATLVTLLERIFANLQK